MRYVIFSFAIFSLVLVLLSYRLKYLYLNIIIAIFFVSALVPIKCFEEINFAPLKYVGKMSYMNDNAYYNINYTVYDILTKKNLPVVTVDKCWEWPNYVLYFDNDVPIRFEKKVPKKDYKYDTYVLIVGQDKRTIRHKQQHKYLF